MKNYKLLYNQLIKILKSERKILLETIPTLTDRSEVIDKIDYEAQKTQLDWILDVYLPELEGKKWNSLFFSKEGFKKWKKKVNNG